MMIIVICLAIVRLFNVRIIQKKTQKGFSPMKFLYAVCLLGGCAGCWHVHSKFHMLVSQHVGHLLCNELCFVSLENVLTRACGQVCAIVASCQVAGTLSPVSNT